MNRGIFSGTLLMQNPNFLTTSWISRQLINITPAISMTSWCRACTLNFVITAFFKELQFGSHREMCIRSITRESALSWSSLLIGDRSASDRDLRQRNGACLRAVGSPGNPWIAPNQLDRGATVIGHISPRWHLPPWSALIVIVSKVK